MSDTPTQHDAKDKDHGGPAEKPLKTQKHQSDNTRLDEALEETFPASDPVSAKHIT